MQQTDESAVLREYAENHSEEAFAALVKGHVNLVYSVALRRAGNPQDAEEITQAVFIILAKKAAQLRHDKALSSWLFQTTRLTAANFVRNEARRHRREQEAHMQSVLNEPGNEVWPRIAPLLDAAVAGLSEKDRRAIVLRYYEGRNLREAGLALGSSEDATEKRVHRALEKLRKFFMKRGMALTATGIAGAVAANSVQAAPAGLAMTISATAAQGAALAPTVASLVKGTLKIMTYAKLKLALGITAAILLAGGAATVAISQTAAGGKWTPQQIAKQAQDAYAALSSYSDSGTVVSEVAGTSLKTVFNIRLQRPDLYRIDWTQTVGGAASSQGITWSDGTGDFFMMGVNGQEMNPPPRKMKDMQQAFASATGVSSTATAIPATFYRQNFGDTLGVAALGGSELEAEGDEKVGGVDCYVFSSKIDPAKWPDHGKLPNNTGQAGTTTSTFWVGKSDHLIHKMVTTTEGQSFTLPKESDADIKTILERQNKPATPEAIAALRTEMDKSMKLVQGAKVVFTQTHENITVNPKFAPGDFAR